MKISIPEGFNTAPLHPRSVFFSVHDSEKPGLEDHVRALQECGVTDIFASGGTAKYLEERFIPVIDFNKEITGKPPIMNHRVTTLGFESAGAILARRNVPQHMKELEMHCHGIFPKPITFDIVAVSIYPFQETIKAEEVDLLKAVDDIDIGGPTLLREAAKNFEWVLPVPGMKWMGKIIQTLRTGQGIPLSLRIWQAVETFALISNYDSAIRDFCIKSYSSPDLKGL